MKITTILTLFGGMCVPRVTAGASATSAGSELPYPVGLMLFSGNIGGHDVQFNGSIQEIHAQMKDVYPDFNPGSLIAGKETTDNGSGTKLTACGGKLQPPQCCPDFDAADKSKIMKGIWHLKAVIASGITCGADLETCARISCSNNAAIYLCNLNNYKIIPNCAYLASYATDIIDACTIYGPRRK